MHTIADELERIAAQLRSMADDQGHVVVDDGVPPGRKLLLARNKLGMSRNTLSELSGVAIGTIEKFENGVTSPRPSTLMKLAPHVELNWIELEEREE